MIQSLLLPCLLAGGLLGAAPAFAETPTPWKPPPGEYKVDMTSTSRQQSPTGVLERIEHRDGETGRTTVTLKGPHTPKPIVNVYPGQGPVRECQYAAMSELRGSCPADFKANGNRATVSYTCLGQHHDVEYEKVGEGVWEKRFKSSPAAGSGPVGLPPQTAAAMAPVIAKMEEEAKRAPPEEAAQLRQQIQAIHRGGGAGAGEGPAVESVQRWTWVSNQCTTKK